MKKTKILIPALGMMMLSTAAAVSGTMAWFTANRSVQVSANEFAVQAIDGSLSVTPAEGIGTEVENGVVKMKNVGESEKRYSLGDASFDINSKQLYTDIAKYDVDTGAGVQPDSYTKISTLAAATDNTWKAAGADIYYAATFTLNFTYNFSGDTRNVDLFFDPASTVEAALVSNGEASLETKKGFRMAFVCGSEIFAWAPFRNESETASLKYVKPADETEAAAATATSTGTYVTTGNNQDCICHDTAISITDGQSGNTSKVNYLATLTNVTPDTTNKAAVTCVVWFEGEDPDVVNATKFQKISTLLKFYIRTAYVGA